VRVIGTLTAYTKLFKIDHPLDPANKYLSHTSVESPDMMNVYIGNVSTDSSGAATVELPPCFEALNRDFRYQLTVIGQSAQAFVQREVDNNRFVIETDQPNVKVSWQITGVRQDAYAEAHRAPVEEEKATDERGRYMYSELYADEAASDRPREQIGYRPSMFGGPESVHGPEAEREAANWQTLISHTLRGPNDSAQ
jgi:hypothetical protein